MHPSLEYTASTLLAEELRWSGQYSRIAGVDEAGRGPLAGPVTAACVQLPKSWIEFQSIPTAWTGLTDSKQLSPQQRDHFFEVITHSPDVSWSIASCSSAQVDVLNILRATHQAMRQAVEKLSPMPDFLLIDGLPIPKFPFKHAGIVKGDSLSLCIAAASVLAKVTRDRAMLEFHKLYPGYGFDVHKGYPTKAHQLALEKLGPCPIHRISFGPVAALSTTNRPPIQIELLGP